MRSAAPPSPTRWLLGTLIAGLLLVAVIQLFVDPYGLWGTPPLPCCTAHKPAMADTERLYKPYWLAEHRPAVVWLGSSRVHSGVPARWGERRAAEVYNAALDGMHVPELEAMVAFLLALPGGPPERVVLGVDLFMVSGRARAPRAGFSQARLDALAAGGPAAWGWRLRETLLSWEAQAAAAQTLAAGLRGHRAPVSVRGTAQPSLASPGPATSRTACWATAWATEHRTTYGGFRWSSRDQERLVAAIRALQEAGVQTVVFLPPLHTDLHLSLALTGLEPRLSELKRALVQTGPVWDFARVHPRTQDRAAFADPGHVRADLGAQLAAVLAGEVDTLGPGYPALLTEDSIEHGIHEDNEARCLLIEKSPLLVEALRTEGDTAALAAQLTAVLRAPDPALNTNDNTLKQ